MVRRQLELLEAGQKKPILKLLKRHSKRGPSNDPLSILQDYDMGFIIPEIHMSSKEYGDYKKQKGIELANGRRINESIAGAGF